MVVIFCSNDLFYYFLDWISHSKFLVVNFINCCFLARGLSSIYKQNSTEFLVDFQELDYFRNLMSNRLGSGFLFFKRTVVS